MPMMRTVRLEMARCHEFPEGSPTHGYELRVPLTAAGKLDRDFWLKDRQGSGFRRFWGGEEEHGEVRHRHHGWTLSFTPHVEADEVIFRADDHRFAVGEYLSIKEKDGVTRTFRIASIQ
jgi:hypothetical protein